MQRSDQKRVLKLISVEEGLDIVSNKLNLKPLDSEIVPLYDSLGRVLGEDVISDQDIPYFDRAAMDGYALKSKETKEASRDKFVRLRIVGKIFPEDFGAKFKIEDGEVAYVACGAPLPLGADAVIRVEETILLDDEIEVYRPLTPWENVSKVGEDVKKGNLILRKGHLLRAQDVGLLAALKKKDLKVFGKPKVAIISVGDELMDLSMNDQDKIVNNYAIVISGLLSELKAMPMILGVVKDDLEEIKKEIDKALEKADIVITIGGCSVGVKDLVPDAVNALGEPGIIFHGIKMSPGKVTGVGMIKNKPIVMLPGQIVSAVAGFYFFVVPIINRLSGLDIVQTLPIIEGELAEEVKAKPGLDTFLLVKVSKESIVEPLPKGRNVLFNLVKANGYTVIPSGKALRKGEKVKVSIFDTKGLTDSIFNYGR